MKCDKCSGNFNGLNYIKHRYKNEGLCLDCFVETRQKIPKNSPQHFVEKNKWIKTLELLRAKKC
jgi:hypothetical protein